VGGDCGSEGVMCVPGCAAGMGFRAGAKAVTVAVAGKAVAGCVVLAMSAAC
jgi:hypothetical protein